jgi:hypothetical protein
MIEQTFFAVNVNVQPLPPEVLVRPEAVEREIKSAIAQAILAAQEGQLDGLTIVLGWTQRDFA